MNTSGEAADQVGAHVAGSRRGGPKDHRSRGKTACGHSVCGTERTEKDQGAGKAGNPCPFRETADGVFRKKRAT